MSGDLPNKVLVPTRAPSNKKHIHTDPDCQAIEGSEVVEKDSEIVGDSYPVCSRCTGDVTVVKVDDAHATRKTLESLSPEEIGLTAIGERRGQA